MKQRDRYAVFERIPQKGKYHDGVMMGYYKSSEEAEQARIKYGYTSDNYYVDKITSHPFRKER